MKCDVMGLLRGAALELRYSDPGRAFALLELGNNLGLLMRGEASLEDWKSVYVGANAEPFDIDLLLPTRRTEHRNEEDRKLARWL